MISFIITTLGGFSKLKNYSTNLRSWPFLGAQLDPFTVEILHLDFSDTRLQFLFCLEA